MDNALKEQLENIENQIKSLNRSEQNFLIADAHKDVLFAEMYRKTERMDLGSSKRTQADRESEVYSSKDWIDFSNGLATAHASFNNERRMYELSLKSFDAEYLSYKINNQAIIRGVGESNEQISSGENGEFRKQARGRSL